MYRLTGDDGEPGVFQCFVKAGHVSIPSGPPVWTDGFDYRLDDGFGEEVTSPGF